MDRGVVATQAWSREGGTEGDGAQQDTLGAAQPLLEGPTLPSGNQHCRPLRGLTNPETTWGCRRALVESSREVGCVSLGHTRPEVMQAGLTVKSLRTVASRAGVGRWG